MTEVSQPNPVSPELEACIAEKTRTLWGSLNEWEVVTE